MHLQILCKVPKYRNQTSIKLHPCKEGEELKHASRVYVSHIKHHNSSIMIAILNSLIQGDQQTLIAGKQVGMIHYITDSPFSQYRNKVMFFVVANHQETFCLQACCQS